MPFILAAPRVVYGYAASTGALVFAMIYLKRKRDRFEEQRGCSCNSGERSDDESKPAACSYAAILDSSASLGMTVGGAVGMTGGGLGMTVGGAVGMTGGRVGMTVGGAVGMTGAGSE